MLPAFSGTCVALFRQKASQKGCKLQVRKWRRDVRRCHESTCRPVQRGARCGMSACSLKQKTTGGPWAPWLKFDHEECSLRGRFTCADGHNLVRATSLALSPRWEADSVRQQGQRRFALSARGYPLTPGLSGSRPDRRRCREPSGRYVEPIRVLYGDPHNDGFPVH